jgi:hypothetical protein
MSEIHGDLTYAEKRVVLWPFAVVGIILVVLLVVGTTFFAWRSSSRKISPTEASLVGTWGDPDYISRQYNDRFTIQFLRDRSFLYVRPPSGPIQGRWAIHDDTLVMRYDGGTPMQNMVNLFARRSVSKWQVLRIDDQLFIRTEDGKTLSYPRISESERDISTQTN